MFNYSLTHILSGDGLLCRKAVHDQHEARPSNDDRVHKPPDRSHIIAALLRKEAGTSTLV